MKTAFTAMPKKRNGRAVRPDPPLYGDPKAQNIIVAQEGEDANPLALISAEQRLILDQIAERLDPEAAQLLMWITGQAVLQGLSDDGAPRYVHFDGNEALAFRGYKQHKRAFRAEDKRKDRDRLIALSKIWDADPRSARRQGEEEREAALAIRGNS